MTYARLECDVDDTEEAELRNEQCPRRLWELSQSRMQGVVKWVCVMQPAPRAAAKAARTARPCFLVVLYSAMSSLGLVWLCPVDRVLCNLSFRNGNIVGSIFLA
eukprot:3801673-Prymnesium_polylepis.1